MRRKARRGEGRKRENEGTGDVTIYKSISL